MVSFVNLRALSGLCCFPPQTTLLASPKKSYNQQSKCAGGHRKFMSEMTIAPVATHGFFVDGRWQEDGDLVEIHAPYDNSLIARVVQGRREHAEAAIAAAVKAFGTTRRLPAFERQRVLRRISASMTRAQGRIRPHARAGSRQAHQGRAHRSRARHLHLQRRRRREHPHLRRISSPRLAGIHRRTLGHRAPLPARPHRRHHAV